jgi:hypothetical protein
MEAVQAVEAVEAVQAVEAVDDEIHKRKRSNDLCPFKI